MKQLRNRSKHGKIYSHHHFQSSGRALVAASPCHCFALPLLSASVLILADYSWVAAVGIPISGNLSSPNLFSIPFMSMMEVSFLPGPSVGLQLADVCLPFVIQSTLLVGWLCIQFNNRYAPCHPANDMVLFWFQLKWLLMLPNPSSNPVEFETWVVYSGHKQDQIQQLCHQYELPYFRE